MLVHRADITAIERHHFEEAIRASGRDPRAFSAELFETTLADCGAVLRPSSGTEWTGKFARHLASGIFG
jgi:hypothetical protein